MMFPLKPPFISGILHGYVSHNQMVSDRETKQHAVWEIALYLRPSKLGVMMFATKPDVVGRFLQ